MSSFVNFMQFSVGIFVGNTALFKNVSTDFMMYLIIIELKLLMH